MKVSSNPERARRRVEKTSDCGRMVEYRLWVRKRYGLSELVGDEYSTDMGNAWRIKCSMLILSKSLRP